MLLMNLGGLGGRPFTNLSALVSWSGEERASSTQTAITHQSEHLKVLILPNVKDRAGGILLHLHVFYKGGTNLTSLCRTLFEHLWKHVKIAVFGIVI